MSQDNIRYAGVYMIMNIANQKVYIGSAIHITKRWAKHRNSLRGNKHNNEHLQTSYNKHGVDNFKYSVIEICEEKILLERETYWITFYNSMLPENGYNCILPTDRKVIRPISQKSKRALLKLNKPPKEKKVKIKKPKKKYYYRKNPEDIIPYSKRNINRKPIQMVNSVTGEELVLPSIMEACKKYSLTEIKVYKCLNAAFGKYKHHNYYFKRLSLSQ